MNNIVVAIAILLGGWGFGDDGAVKRLQIFLEWQQIGSSADFFLVKRNFAGEYERVAIVFGYWDDGSACIDLADAYMSRHPADTYVCWPAN